MSVSMCFNRWYEYNDFRVDFGSAGRTGNDVKIFSFLFLRYPPVKIVRVFVT